ncbi:MAG: stage II sporulation protein M [Terriglobia bacterium]
MVTASWIDKRKPHWLRLEEMTGRTGIRTLKAFSPAELQEISLLYRQVATDLSTLREDPLNQRTARYLNQLLARTHNLIYMGRRSSPAGIVTFYRSEFPRAFRRAFPYVVCAFAVFLCAAVAGALVCLGDPAFQRFFLGAAMTDTIERHQMWTHSVLAIKPLASSFIMTNNLSVSFAMFASGITAGIGTVYMLLANGLLFGVITAACWQAGMLGQLMAFVAPHGVLELPAVFIAAGGGLLIARALLFPGNLPRRDALVQHGALAVRLALGIIPILVIAAIIEAFLSPSAVSSGIKYLIAGIGATLLTVYLTKGGREAE